MSKISRRSLLGYSGTAAAGAVLATSATSSAAAASGEAADTEAAAAVEFENGTEFSGITSIGPIDAQMSLTFSVRVVDVPAANNLTPLEVAEALSALAEARGWPPITFYGSPPPAPLN